MDFETFKEIYKGYSPEKKLQLLVRAFGTMESCRVREAISMSDDEREHYRKEYEEQDKRAMWLHAELKVVLTNKQEDRE